MASSPNIGGAACAGANKISYHQTFGRRHEHGGSRRRHVHRKTPLNGALNGKAILTYEATGGTNFRSESFASISPCADHFRSSPISGHSQSLSACLESADFGPRLEGRLDDPAGRLSPVHATMAVLFNRPSAPDRGARPNGSHRRQSISNNRRSRFRSHFARRPVSACSL
jgi:hypothetical protein